MAIIFDDQFSTAGDTSVIGRSPDVNPFVSGAYNVWSDNSAYGGTTCRVTGGSLQTVSGAALGTEGRPSMGAGGTSYGNPTFLKVDFEWVAPTALELAAMPIGEAPLLMYVDATSAIDGSCINVLKDSLGYTLYSGTFPAESSSVTIVPGQTYAGSYVFGAESQSLSFLGVTYTATNAYSADYGLSRVVVFVKSTASINYLTISDAPGKFWTSHTGCTET